MSQVSFADVVFSSATFSKENEGEALILRLIDTVWFQRLRDISQTANTRLVYMFSEHSRFGHSVGVAYLTSVVLEKLAAQNPKEIEQYRTAVLTAALLHDIGHLAPGSHTAYHTWFPESADLHEEVSCRVILEDPEIREILSDVSTELPMRVAEVLKEESTLPPWTWQVISGGGWNTDRGNWCIVDSVLAGVKYGQYNIAALTDSILLTKDKELALAENRLDAMMHFALSRHAMYRQLYQHRVLMACDRLNFSIAKRARLVKEQLPFCDDTMQQALQSSSPLEMPLETLRKMTESWWRYHITQWIDSGDQILSDLCSRLTQRRLLKTVRVQSENEKEKLLFEAKNAVIKSGYDPEYYLHHFSLAHMHRSERQQSMKVLMDDGTVIPMLEAEPLYGALLNETQDPGRTWIALPKEAKEKLGRKR